MVDNAFGILEKTFKELIHKSNLNVTFLPNVFTCYCLLHHLLKTEDEACIKHLFHIIELEASTSHENQPVYIAQDDQPTNQKLDGEERSKEFL
jgi:hypothetical protein